MLCSPANGISCSYHRVLNHIPAWTLVAIKHDVIHNISLFSNVLSAPPVTLPAAGYNTTSR